MATKAKATKATAAKPKARPRKAKPKRAVPVPTDERVYTCVGLMRGPCGVAHRTKAEQAQCMRDDADHCDRVGIAHDRRAFSVPVESRKLCEGTRAAQFVAMNQHARLEGKPGALGVRYEH